MGKRSCKIAILKFRAGKHYRAYHAACDNLPCGRSIAEVVSSKVMEHKRKFNQLMDELAALDPECPTTRL